MSAYYSDIYILDQNIIVSISSKSQNISSKQTCDLTSRHSIRRGEILTLNAIFSNNLVLFARERIDMVFGLWFSGHTLTDDQKAWIKKCSDLVLELISQTPPDGELFLQTVKVR